MKVILLRDVAKIGKRFEIVEVPDGFALNKLIPARDAEPATSSNIKRINQDKARNLANKSELLNEIKDIINKITNEPIVVSMETNEKGHLFQAVHTKDIAESAKKRNLNLTENLIFIEQPIKNIGEHKVTIKLHDFQAEIMIKIEAK